MDAEQEKVGSRSDVRHLFYRMVFTDGAKVVNGTQRNHRPVGHGSRDLPVSLRTGISGREHARQARLEQGAHGDLARLIQVNDSMQALGVLVVLIGLKMIFSR